MSDHPEEGESTEDAADFQRARKTVAALPATYVDTWFLTTWRDHIRISLGESFTGLDNQYRFAFMMESKEAERLAVAILEMIEKRKERDRAKNKDENTTTTGGDTD